MLFDVGHPAQVHLFRNAIAELDAMGHETFVASRVKEVTVGLLDAYDIDHSPLTTRGDSVGGLVTELLEREVKLLRLARSFDPDVIVSRLSPAAAHVSTLLGCQNVVVSDTLVDSTPMRVVYHVGTLPFVDTLCAPASFDLPFEPADRRPLDFQELAYLHPNYFQPDPEALAADGIDPTESYFLLRLVGWDAYHDVGHAGLSPKGARELVAFLTNHGRVYISAESELPSDLQQYSLETPPERIHDVLFHADLYVGDSGTMSTEAALLGTPAIRTNSMVGEEEEEPIFRALESEYGLLRSFTDETAAIETARELVRDGIDEGEWQSRRDRVIAEQPDVTERIVETVLDAASD